MPAVFRLVRLSLCAAGLCFLLSSHVFAQERARASGVGVRLSVEQVSALRDDALALFVRGNEEAAEARLRIFGRGDGDDDLVVASELARLAFQAMAADRHDLAARLARRALSAMQVERLRHLSRAEDRVARLKLAAALHERVLGDAFAGARMLELAVVDAPEDALLARDCARLRQRHGKALQRQQAAEREALELRQAEAAGR